MDAYGRASLIVPSSSFIPGGLICVNACWTEINEITGKRTFQGAITVPAKIGAVPDLHSAQVAVPGEFLIESTAAPAVDATIHFMLNEWSHVLILVSPLLSRVASDPVAARNGHVLEQAVATFITDRAVVRMV